MIRKQTKLYDSSLKLCPIKAANCAYVAAVTLEEVTFALSHAEPEWTESYIDKLRSEEAPLLIGCDDETVIARASLLAYRTETLVTKCIDSSDIPPNDRMLRVGLAFFKKHMKVPFLQLHFWFSQNGQNTSMKVIGWVGPNGKIFKTNVQS